MPNLGLYGGLWSYSEGFVILDHHHEKYCVMTFFNNSSNTSTSYLGNYFNKTDNFVFHGINRFGDDTIFHVQPVNDQNLHLDLWKIDDEGELESTGPVSLFKRKL